MRKALLVVLLAAAVLAVPAAARLPRAGVLVPGRSLGGIRLGETAHAVRAVLGQRFGVCDNCARQTWYFTYRLYEAKGLAVEFEQQRVVGIYTLWQPKGWRATNGLRLGATPLEVHDHAGRTHTVTCQDYDALVSDRPSSTTAYYLYNGSLWGFGLFRGKSTPCR